MTDIPLRPLRKHKNRAGYTQLNDTDIEAGPGSADSPRQPNYYAWSNYSCCVLEEGREEVTEGPLCRRSRRRKPVCWEEKCMMRRKDMLRRRRLERSKNPYVIGTFRVLHMLIPTRDLLQYYPRVRAHRRTSPVQYHSGHQVRVQWLYQWIASLLDS